ncbi:MAG: AAA family ATPase, partial [Thermodesulfovibrionales bacterium]|nr:AAA family ATPase [Thermodesulfovibrionales bacterium]
MPETKIIAFVNFKGGVGKTANVVNLASCLAKYHDKKVLIIDLDAQSNTTFWLLKREYWKQYFFRTDKTVCQIFDDYIYKAGLFNFDECVVKGVPQSDTGLCYIKNLDILPSAPALLKIEDELHLRALVKDNFKPLSNALENHIDKYDYVFIDCPPNIYTVTKNALYFADYCIIPFIPDFLSLSGFRIFSQIVCNFQKQVGTFRGDPNESKIRGIIINRFKNIGNVFTISLNELILDLKALKELKLVHPDIQV